MAGRKDGSLLREGPGVQWKQREAEGSRPGTHLLATHTLVEDVQGSGLPAWWPLGNTFLNPALLSPSLGPASKGPLQP